MREATIDSISIYVTTLCNLKCIGCCAGTQSKNNITIEEIREIGKNIPHIKNLFITGGEPTLHKNFREIMKEIFKLNYDNIILATNGYNLMKYIDLIDKFDDVRISHYNENSFEGAIPNTEVIKEFQDNYKGNTRVLVEDKIMISENKKKNPCGRAYSGVASYFRGKIYGCCVAAGMDTSEGIPIDKKWKESALKAKLPCDECVFAV